MDSWPSEMLAFTECQLAHIHYHLSNNCSTIVTKYDINVINMTNYCKKNPDEMIRIKAHEKVIWDYNKSLNTDVLVESGGELIISCRVGMATDALIKVQRGARLQVIDGGTVTHNSVYNCNCKSERWKKRRRVGRR